MRWVFGFAPLVVILAVFLVFTPAQAANLTFSADTPVHLTDISAFFTILANSTADSLVVNATSVAVTVTSGVSTAQLRSTSTEFLVTGGATTVTGCSNQESTITISGTGTATLQPASFRCGGQSTGVGAGVVGGGGAPAPSPAPARAPVSQATTTVVQTMPRVEPQLEARPIPQAQQLIQAPRANVIPLPRGFTFARPLAQGLRHTEVRNLQRALSGILNLDEKTIVTGYFGPLTRKAVGQFQEKYGIARPQDSGYGTVGPKTRRELNRLITAVPSPTGITTPVAPLPSQPSLRALEDQINTLRKQVEELLKQQRRRAR